MNTFRNVLSQYLTRCNHLEILGESIRQNLAKNPYFQHVTIFQRMDRFRKGYLIPADFMQFMFQNQIYPNQIQLYVIFRDFDIQRIGTVTIEKFAGQILPKQNQKLKKQAHSKKYYPTRERLELDLQFLLAKYFQHKIKQHNQLEQIRQRLKQLYIIYPQEAFLLIDRNKKLFLTVTDFDMFLRGSGKVLKQQELNRIFRVLSWPLSALYSTNQKISFQKFTQHLQPLSKGYYPDYAQRVLQKQKIEHQYIQRKLTVEKSIIQNSRREIQAKLQIQNLKHSRNHLENILLEREMQIKSNRLETQLRLSNRFY